MIRYFYCLGLLLSCLGLTAQAKGLPPTCAHSPAPVPAPKAATKAGADKTASTKVATPLPVAVTLQVTPAIQPSPVCAATPLPVKPGTFSSKGTVLRAVATTSAISSSIRKAASGRLARLTAYWASEGDFYTRKGVSSTGVRLHGGHCAVDPRIIPYGSVVEIEGVGKYLAVDTGSAVISREAAREAAHSPEERSALVVDLYFETRRDGEKFAATSAKYASISWWTPGSTGSDAKEARNLFADENWTKIQNKQL